MRTYLTGPNRLLSTTAGQASLREHGRQAARSERDRPGEQASRPANSCRMSALASVQIAKARGCTAPKLDAGS
jgi:hypothetical protein